MNRKIAALALVAVAALGACGSNEPEAAPTESTVPYAPTTTWAPQDLALVDVTVTKPAPGSPKVDPSVLPEEVANFTAIPGLAPEQQDCLNSALKQAIDKDPSMAKTPGKRASLSGTAITVCGGSALFTDPLVDGVTSNESASTVKLTPEQATCYKSAFATDTANTAKVIGASMVMGTTPDVNVNAIKDALAPFDAKCKAKLSDAFGANGPERAPGVRACVARLAPLWHACSPASNPPAPSISATCWGRCGSGSRTSTTPTASSASSTCTP